MKISSAAISLIAVMSQPNGGHSQDLLRGGDSKVALASDVGGHDSSLQKPNPTFPIIHASPTKRCHAPDPKDPNFVPKDIPPGFVPKNCYGTPIPREKKEIPSSHRERKEKPPPVPRKDRKRPPVELEETGPSVGPDTDVPSTLPPGCDVTWASYIGDGRCDKSGGYNTEACGYDGGDCCYSTCKNGAHPELCGYQGYACQDTSVPLDQWDENGLPPGCVTSTPGYVGDGYCDNNDYNTEACNYDGGDCCFSTCINGAEDCGRNGYDCQDPSGWGSWPGLSCVVANPEYVGNGICNKDGNYNTEACDYDGGDCCFFTCVDGAGDCGVYGYEYDCKDLSTFDVPNPEWIGDGICDYGDYNTAPFDYDGGDCCYSTCTKRTCGSRGYSCQDPSVPAIPSGCNVYGAASWIGDGWCDGGDYNTPECNYDGGDCCIFTCSETAKYSSGINGYDCQDPSWASFCNDPSVVVAPQEEVLN